MKSSLHSLITFSALFCNRQLNSIPLLPSSYPGRPASRNPTQFFSTELFCITTLHGPRRKHCLSIVGKVCLKRRCIARNVYSDFTTPALGRHVTLFFFTGETKISGLKGSQAVLVRLPDKSEVTYSECQERHTLCKQPYGRAVLC
jgi:hypothetical protein